MTAWSLGLALDVRVVAVNGFGVVADDVHGDGGRGAGVLEQALCGVLAAKVRVSAIVGAVKLRIAAAPSTQRLPKRSAHRPQKKLPTKGAPLYR